MEWDKTTADVRDPESTMLLVIQIGEIGTP